MNTSIQSKFFAPLLIGLSLTGMLFLLPYNAKADIIPATGQCTGGFGCTDPNYAVVGGVEPLKKVDLSGTAPGFLAAPAGLSGAFWIAMLGDVQFGEAVNDWRVTFVTPANPGTITVTGTMAAEGSVGVAVDGVGKFAGPQSLTQLGNFSVTVNAAPGTAHTLDFIFTGCISYPACSASNEPVFGLLVDPSWGPALHGAPLDTIPESTLVADGGVAPNSAVPEPSCLLVLGACLLGVVGASRSKRCG